MPAKIASVAIFFFAILQLDGGEPMRSQPSQVRVERVIAAWLRSSGDVTKVKRLFCPEIEYWHKGSFYHSHKALWGFYLKGSAVAEWSKVLRKPNKNHRITSSTLCQEIYWGKPWLQLIKNSNYWRAKISRICDPLYLKKNVTFTILKTAIICLRDFLKSATK